MAGRTTFHFHEEFVNSQNFMYFSMSVDHEVHEPRETGTPGVRSL